VAPSREVRQALSKQPLLRRTRGPEAPLIADCRPLTLGVLAPGKSFQGLLAGTLSSLLAAGAFAQTPAKNPAETTRAPQAEAEDATIVRAREAFVLGTALAREGQWVDALAAFERSARLRPHPVTTYNLAYCERALGRYTRALQLFRLALADHAVSKGGNLTEQLSAQAQSYLAEIERRVARATVRISPAGATLTVDGRGLEAADTDPASRAYVAGTGESTPPAPAPGGWFELLLDPGRHTFVVARPGSADRIVTETLGPGERRRLELAIEDPDAPPRAVPAPRPAAPGRDYTWPILAYGVGAAGLAIGTVFGIATFNEEASLAENCIAKRCADPADLDTAERYALVANIGFAVGLAGAGLGTFLLFTTGHERLPEQTAPAPKVSLRGWVSPVSAGLRGTF
jgi:hypothetical protein